MNDEQKQLVERMLAIYRKYDHELDYFHYFIDDQEVYEYFEESFNFPNSILEEYTKNYNKIHNLFLDDKLTKEDMKEPLNILRALKEYVKNHPVKKH